MVTLMAKALKPVHPGDILAHDFLEPMELSANKLAKEIGVAAPTVNEIVRGNKAVTAPMALRLARYFGTSAAFWLNIQTQFDLEVAEKEIAKALSSIKPRRVEAA
jgi:addiction module HigA family antidote